MPTIADVEAYLSDGEKTFLEDTVDRARDGYTGEKVTFGGFAGRDSINPFGYGCPSPMKDAAKRHQHQKAIEWLGKKWMPDAHASFYESMRLAGEPPGEKSRMIGGRFVPGDTNSLRHMSCAGFIDCGLDEDILRESPMVIEEVVNLAKKWGHWLLASPVRNWQKRAWDNFRLPLPIRDLVAIYEVTEDREWLDYATELVRIGWSEFRPVFVTHNEEGKPFLAWDTGLKEERAAWGKRLNPPWNGFIYGADRTMYARYLGETAEAFIRLWPHIQDDPGTQYIVKTFIKEAAKWCDRETAPISIKLGIRNSLIQGGLPEGAADRWVRPGEEILTPEGWLQKKNDEKYLVLQNPEWLEPDQDYHADREHHQGDPGDGPDMSKDGYLLSELLHAHYLLTGNQRSELMALWYTFDRMAFGNQSGHRAFSFDQASKAWGRDARGTGRGMSWTWLCGWRLRQRRLK